MAIRRPDPIRALADLQDRINRLFDEARTISGGADDSTTVPGIWRPAVDLIERDGGYVLWADVPGVDPSDVRIEVESSTLTLRGERRPDHERSAEAYLRSERPTGPFAVSLSLPPSVDARSIRASQKAGVLEVSLPKREPEGRDAIRVEVDRSEP